MRKALIKESSTRKIALIQVGNSTIIEEEEKSEESADTKQNLFSNNRMENRLTNQRIDQFL